jgi:hypothetical protein
MHFAAAESRFSIRFQATIDLLTLLQRMSPHSAAPYRLVSRSFSAIDSGEPPYDFTVLPTNSDRSDSELIHSRRGILDAPPLQQSQSLPSINSILHHEITRLPPTQEPTHQPHGLPLQRMSFPFCQAPMPRNRGSQPVNTGSFWSQAYVTKAQSPSQMPLALTPSYSPQFQMPNWQGRIEHSQMVAESKSADQMLDVPQVHLLRCEYLDPLTGHVCDSSFSRHDCLLRHKRTVHSPGKAKWQCRLCDGHRRFTRHDSLARHMRQIHAVFDFPGKQRSSI